MPPGCQAFSRSWRKKQPYLSLPVQSQAVSTVLPNLLGPSFLQSTKLSTRAGQGRAGGRVVAHLLILSVFKVDRVVSHAEDGENEIDESEDAVQPQETVPGGGEEGTSECCGRCMACGPAWRSAPHPQPPPPPSGTSPSHLPGPQGQDGQHPGCWSRYCRNEATQNPREHLCQQHGAASSASRLPTTTVLMRGADRHGRYHEQHAARMDLPPFWDCGEHRAWASQQCLPQQQRP